MPIRAVLFDMGNTLVKPDVETEAVVFQRVLRSLGISKSLEETKMTIMNTKQEAEDLDLFSLFGKIRSEEYWHKWNSLVLKHLGIEENVELAKTVHSMWFDFIDFILYPEVKDVLMELQQRGLKLGLISTAYEAEIHLVLERVNLEKATFDIIVGVDTAQCMKPHPDIFKYAVKELDMKPEETIFVGDDVEADYKGAERVGIKAILVEREEADIRKTSGLRTIGNLEEIFRYIG